MRRKSDSTSDGLTPCFWPLLRFPASQSNSPAAPVRPLSHSSSLLSGENFNSYNIAITWFASNDVRSNERDQVGRRNADGPQDATVGKLAGRAELVDCGRRDAKPRSDFANRIAIGCECLHCPTNASIRFPKLRVARFESGFPLQFIPLRGLVVSVPGPPLALFTARGSAPILTRVRARSRRAAAPSRPQLKLTLAAVVAVPAAVVLPRHLSLAVSEQSSPARVAARTPRLARLDD